MRERCRESSTERTRVVPLEIVRTPSQLRRTTTRVAPDTYARIADLLARGKPCSSPARRRSFASGRMRLLPNLRNERPGCPRCRLIDRRRTRPWRSTFDVLCSPGRQRAGCPGAGTLIWHDIERHGVTALRRYGVTPINHNLELLIVRPQPAWTGAPIGIVTAVVAVPVQTEEKLHHMHIFLDF